MSVGSIQSNTSVQPAPKTTRAETTEATRGGKDLKSDGDTEGAALAQKASAPKPTTNFQGQAIGQTINVSA